jgi:hypothetical protein
LSAEKKKGYFIIKKSNQPSPFDKYIKNKVEPFQGRMNTLANSIEVLLDDIFKKTRSMTPKMETFGRKIDRFGKNRSNLEKYTPSFDELLYKLKRFNKYWNISKHGMVLGEENMKDITIVDRKDDVYYVFDKKKIEEIEQDFAQIQKALIEIQKSII